MRADLVPAEEVRRATDEVLSRRAYATAEPSWWERWFESARRWVAEQFLMLLEATSTTVVGWSVVIVATLVALLVAWRVSRGTRWERARPAAPVDHERLPASGWDERSRRAERDGDLREAVRTAYRAVLAGYDEAGIVDEVEGRTVGEYRRAVAIAAPLRSDAFARASDVVEEVLYADRPARPDDLVAVRAAALERVGAGA